jgi:hypothetical protein|tara:strand:- start:274 stop:831 length:558 start_codon:yes stop_codon:yes gene_type:complete
MYCNTVDIDIDYTLLVEDFYKLNLDELLNQDPFQLAVQCRSNTNKASQLYESCGSLIFDWQEYEKNPIGKLPLRKQIFKESEFVEVCDIFKDTYIKTVVNLLKERYPIVRGRFMKMKHKTCLSMHSDSSPRIHVPIYTNPGCMMIVNDTIVRMPINNTYFVDTTVPHTALNASKNDRVHMVFCIS